MDAASRTSIVGQLSVPGFSVQVLEFDLAEDTLRFRNDGEHALTTWLTPQLVAAHGWIAGEHSAGTRLGDTGVIFAPAGSTIVVHTRPGLHRVVTTWFTPERLNQVLGQFSQPDQSPIMAILNIQDARTSDVLRQLADEALAPGYASVTLTEALGTSLIVHLLRYLGQESNLPRACRGGLSGWQMRRVAECVSHGGESRLPSVAELAVRVGVTPRHLERAFKQSMGLRISDYIENARLIRAKAMLSESDLLMKEVAAKLGYAGQNGFTVAFRRWTGETPSAFRDRARSQRRSRVAPTTSDGVQIGRASVSRISSYPG